MKKEIRPGYKWIEVSETTSEGYWVKESSGATHSHKLPFFCPNPTCARITGTVDDEYMRTYGVCYLCFTMYVDARETPAIDLSKFRPSK